MAESFPNKKKTLWEKKKLLITSNFSCSLSVFKKLVLQRCKNQGFFGKGLTLVPFSYNFTWLFYQGIVLGFNTTLTAKVISQLSMTHVFPGFLTPILAQLSSTALSTFLTCLSRGERQNYARKKVRLNSNSNHQVMHPNTLTTESPGWGLLSLSTF